MRPREPGSAGSTVVGCRHAVSTTLLRLSVAPLEHRHGFRFDRHGLSHRPRRPPEPTELETRVELEAFAVGERVLRVLSDQGRLLAEPLVDPTGYWLLVLQGNGPAVPQRLEQAAPLSGEPTSLGEELL